jgi:hypothetical protein
VLAKVREHGTDCWWALDVEELLPEENRNDGRKHVIQHPMSHPLSTNIQCRTRYQPTSNVASAINQHPFYACAWLDQV